MNSQEHAKEKARLQRINADLKAETAREFRLLQAERQLRDRILKETEEKKRNVEKLEKSLRNLKKN